MTLLCLRCLELEHERDEIQYRAQLVQGIARRMYDRLLDLHDDDWLLASGIPIDIDYADTDPGKEGGK